MSKKRAWWLLVLASSLLAGPLHAEAPALADSARSRDVRRARDEDATVLPAHAQGDIHFVADCASFRVTPDTTRVYVILQVPYQPLHWVRSGPLYRASVHVEAELKEEHRGRSRTIETTETLEAESFEETRAPDTSGLLVLAADGIVNPTEIAVTVEDPQSEKKTLLGKIRGDRLRGTAAGRLPSRPSSTGHAFVSPLLIGSSSRSASDPDCCRADEIVCGGIALTPSPSHYFGRRSDVFIVYYEVLDLDDAGRFGTEPETNRVRYRILSTTGEELLSSTEDQEAASGRAGRVQRFSVANYPVGTYTLAVELLGDDVSVIASSYADFNVFWDESAWSQDEAGVLDDARVLLSPLEYEEFERKPPGERASFLARLWTSIDPTPATEGNELHDEFQARLAHARKAYGGLEGGQLSDRGRLYIRFGAPDEVIRVAVPSRNETIFEVIQEEVFGSLGGIVDPDDPRLIQFLKHEFDGNPSFEIWKYYAGGNPLLPAQRTMHHGIAFVLVDDQGTGFYRLGYSSIGDIMN